MKPKATRTIGIDYGMARMGIAVSDERKLIASPLATVFTEKKLEITATKLLEELAKYQQRVQCEIEEIIIGLPLQMNGKMGMLADEVTHFIEVLRGSITIPIKTWDERLTTVQAERSMKGAMTRKKRSKVIDTVTATIILQSYLDCKSFQH